VSKVAFDASLTGLLVRLTMSSLVSDSRFNIDRYAAFEVAVFLTIKVDLKGRVKPVLASVGGAQTTKLVQIRNWAGCRRA
jgi:hypothetical protein